MSLAKLKKELKKYSHPDKVKIYQRFFKTGPGEYGEGDIFIGVTVPENRSVAKKFVELELDKIEKLLHSKIHEERMAALFILIQKFEKGDKDLRKKIFNLYLKNTKHINNWDLIDLSANKIIGAHLLDKKKNVLYKLARSKSLWEKRIAIIATAQFIANNKFDDTLKISKILLEDKHDLIHKAVGWMLREVGKRSLEEEEKFLKKYYKKMPRTMLRYAIERFPEPKRKKYLTGHITVI